MPLELGMFLAAKHYGSNRQKRKTCLILDRSPHRYQKFISDIAGQDIKSHGASWQKAIGAVRDFLRNANRGALIPSGAKMCERFEAFRRNLPAFCQQLQWDEDDLIFNDYTTAVSEWLKVHARL